MIGQILSTAVTLLVLLVIVRGTLGRWPTTSRRDHRGQSASGDEGRRSNGAAVLFATVGLAQLLLDWSPRLDTHMISGGPIPALVAMLLLTAAAGIRLPAVQAMLTAVGALAGLTGVWLDHGADAAAALTVVIAILY